MSNETNSRNRQRYQNCHTCGGIYQVVLLGERGGARRECGCRVRVVPTPEERAEVADLDRGDADVEAEATTDGGVDRGDGPRTDGGRDARRPGGRSPGQEGYWSELSAEAEARHAADGGDDLGDEDEDDDVPTVRDRVREELDGRIHGIAVTAVRGSTHYLVVSHDAESRGGDVVALHTVAVDLDESTVRVNGDNSMWVPRETSTLDSLTRVVARTTSDVSNDAGDPPVETGVDEVDVDELLSTEVEPDTFERPADGWGVEWGNGKGGPDEATEFAARLAEAGVPTERFTNLVYGEKRPFKRYQNHDAESLLGNYGVEVGVPGSTEEFGVDDRVLEDDPLVVLDVDYPEAAPLDRLPETYRVSSASGSDDRAHHYLVVDDLDAVVDHFDGRGTVKPEWGDVWLFGEYVVGPGCYHEESGGRYEVVSDAPITEVSAEWLIDLLDDGVEDESDEDDVDDVQVDEEDDTEDGRVTTRPTDASIECDECGDEVDPSDEEVKLTDRGDGPVYLCEVCK